MKYTIIFVVVFLMGFGVFQLMNPEQTPPKTESIQQSIETVAIISSDSMENKITQAEVEVEVEEDMSDYTMVDGFYDVSWKDLSKVEFEDRMNHELNTMIAYPLFHPSIKKLDGKTIQIKGYVIPFEETGDESIVILSAFPFSSCFFCGGAGPETVMDVQLKKQPIRFKQDALVSFKGKLRLNDTDLDYLNYILDEAEVLK
jgi:hypothetical protein